MSNFDLHDSYIEDFNFDFDNLQAYIRINLGDWQEKAKCEIEFYGIKIFHIELNNANFIENEILSANLHSTNDELFDIVLSEGPGKSCKILKILCDNVIVNLV